MIILENEEELRKENEEEKDQRFHFEKKSENFNITLFCIPRL